jgi:hypothetical protein
MDDASVEHRSRTERRRRSLVIRCALLALAAVAWLPGCAAFHPLRGVPASYLPEQYEGDRRAGKKTINLSLLVRRPPDQYRIDSGDVLAVYIPGVLGKMSANLDEAGEEPPINTPYTLNDPPTIGYPVTVRDDGTIPMPYVKPIHVAGRTLSEVEDAIRRAYSVDTTILSADADVQKRIVVSLQRAREYRILVVRQEMANILATQNQISNVNIGNSKRGTSKIVQLRAYENDVLHALSRAEGADGLPGLDAENAIYVIRRRGRLPQQASAHPTPAPGVAPGWGTPPQPAVMPMGHSISTVGHTAPSGGASAHGSVLQTGHSVFNGQAPGSLSNASPASWEPLTDDPAAWGWSPDMALTMDDPGIIRIPVRLGAGETPHITEDDVTLYDGDIVFIESRETEVFYTGGLLGGGQFTLPRDYDVTLTQAISIAQGRATTGGAPRAIGGVSALNSDVTISPSHVVVLRTLPDGRRFPIEADLYKALRRPQEDLIIQPGDMILLQYTHVEAIAAFFERHLLEGAFFGIAAAQLQSNNSNN